MEENYDMKEQIKQELENVNSMITVIQNDLMNVEGSSTEEATCNTLEILKAYIKSVSVEIDCI
jgi:hypothetical protein